VPQSDFAKGAIVGTLVVTAAVASLWLLGLLAPLDDDDRPPIIVSNGTIEFQAIPVLGNPGSWTRSGNTWQHQHGKGGPKHFRVHIGGSQTTGCTADTYSPVTKITIEDSVTPGSFDVTPEQGSAGVRYMQVATTNLDVAIKGGTLSIGKPASWLSKITLYKNSATLVACTYQQTETPQILIEQKR
jgi:hypothetical protein